MEFKLRNKSYELVILLVYEVTIYFHLIPLQEKVLCTVIQIMKN